MTIKFFLSRQKKNTILFLFWLLGEYKILSAVDEKNCFFLYSIWGILYGLFSFGWCVVNVYVSDSKILSIRLPSSRLFKRTRFSISSFFYCFKLNLISIFIILYYMHAVIRFVIYYFRWRILIHKLFFFFSIFSI